ncbi:nuclear transport factor 2 family protein [Sphingosinicella sp. BN140058]|uniref:YybH family protein n=1 Tax=Sphingosinicella sp. BN140058 TaxID=1892855 RepID=UPI001012E8D4|nr:nuclear transport factor 2 family protein [Sphingosinicella sp. BN140058]QAY77812.1 nuclear transport factor 2 family protein [Sphingosinicella sp. BN140058]
MEQERAREFATTWVDAWNRHDLDAVLDHYGDDVRFHSPFARLLTGDGRVDGKAALRAYWREGLARRPALRFELIDLFEGDGALALHLSDERGKRVVETMLFDAEGKVTLSTGCYLR